MPTAPTHAIVALALGAGFRRATPPPSLLALGAWYSVLPDLDVIGFRFGIAYGDLLGHRGLTHSLSFAVALASVTVACRFRRGAGVSAPAAWTYLTLATASHGLLDGFTDGGLGVAFFAPFSGERYFFPWRPIAVAPIGLAGLLRPTILPVLASEFRWVWLPVAVLFGVLRVALPRAKGPVAHPGA
jgi:inner membrane protein